MARRFAGDPLVVASHNPGKVARSRRCWRRSVATRSAAALGLPEPEETGDTFEENAALKARAAAEASGLLGAGRRFRAGRAGAGRRAGHLLGALGRAGQGFPRRDGAGAGAELGRQGPARPFRRALALAWPDGHCECGRGGSTARWSGRRAATRLRLRPDVRARRIRHTFGEMDPDEKHRISHRAGAFEKLVGAVSPDGIR